MDAFERRTTPGAYNSCIGVLWKKLEKGTGKAFVTME